jgi:NAD(P)-dependent dehydrogenase (short-subunit alcohol dehydrogenase family)
MTAPELVDPTKLYPAPPFPKQTQPEPGSAARMEPEPDHGEHSYVGHGRLEGRKALVTGGDSGIGRAVAIAFAREGADVAISYLPDEQEDAETTARYVREAGRTAALLPTDIAVEQNCVELVADAARELDGLDTLVMVAGEMYTIDSIDDFTTEALDRTLRTNVYSLFWLTKAALEHLPKGGTIVTTSSVQGFNPSPTLVEYAVSKGGVVNFTRAMAGQLAERGIRVNGVAPGPFWTPLQPSSVPTEKLETFGSNLPYGRPGQPAEIASTYVYLAAADGTFTSGETIVVNVGASVH